MPKKFLIILSCCLCLTSLIAQNFEGQITYKIVYETKNTQVTDHLWETRLGTLQDYYFKGGNYKVVSNSDLVEWQLYLNKENKIYNKIKNETNVFGTDASIVADSLVTYDVKYDVKAVLGYTCNEITLTCKGGTYTYYYNNQLKLDFNQFKNHEFDNWASFIKLSGSVPLKIVIENNQYRKVMTATAIEQKVLDLSFFAIPPDVNIAKVE